MLDTSRRQLHCFENTDGYREFVPTADGCLSIILSSSTSDTINMSITDPQFAGHGRGYVTVTVKWRLEISFLLLVIPIGCDLVLDSYISRNHSHGNSCFEN